MTMDNGQMMDAVVELRDHLYHDSEKYVQKWSAQKCKYYDGPLMGLVGVLSDGSGQKTLRVERPETLAMVDIVKHSPLCQILEYDAETKCIRIRDSITPDEWKLISDYLFSRAIIIATHRD